ncbi:MAG: gamma-glutamylcyclotransferase [Minicystis sp.]
MSLWIFAYGSLLWRPGFAFEERPAAVVRGFVRRLDQGSPDHRGTPERLGRVATLMRAPGGVCGGAVYRIADRDAPAVLEMLDVREQGGYDRVALTAEIVGGPAVTATTWIASPDNAYHLGPAPLATLAAQIRAAVGPSGANVDYVLALDDALRALGIDDPHVVEVAAAVREA